MFDIKELKRKITEQDGIALSEALEHRIMNDELTERDYEFLKRAFGITRELSKH